MIRLAPVALLILALIVPLCTGTIWGNLVLLAIVCGIFFGTVSLGRRGEAEAGPPLGTDDSAGGGGVVAPESATR